MFNPQEIILHQEDEVETPENVIVFVSAYMGAVGGLFIYAYLLAILLLQSTNDDTQTNDDQKGFIFILLLVVGTLPALDRGGCVGYHIGRAITPSLLSCCSFIATTIEVLALNIVNPTTQAINADLEANQDIHPNLANR